MHHQAWVLAAILLFGVLVASGAGLWLSAYLTRPLKVLSASAVRLATGENSLTLSVEHATRGDELGVLVDDFLRMERAIRQRDRELREAANLLERRVVERTLELEAAQKALVSAERFAGMGKTSAAIGHELKNALNGLGMAVELILENPTSPRVSRLKGQVLSETDRLRDVVDSLSSFSHSPRRRAAGRRSPRGGAACGRDVWRTSSPIEGPWFRSKAPSALPFACDGHKIQGVVMNLLKNAVEAAKRVEVRVASEERQGRDLGGGRRSGHYGRGERAFVRAFLHDEAQRHGARARHVTSLRQSPRGLRSRFAGIPTSAVRCSKFASLRVSRPRATWPPSK